MRGRAQESLRQWLARTDLRRLAAGTQCVWYVLTGLWSLVDIHSFMAVTGPKTDIWLVRTVGALIIVIGSVLGMAAIRRRIGLQEMALGVGSALALAVVEIGYAATGVISPIYLIDGVVELVLLGLWFAGWVRGAAAQPGVGSMQ
ncbi:hypothetical protein PCS_02071 [Desulfocurvibacter africanus PCS]|uniref:Uncharacterized protein n=1 Tax=Desulfocurvibacter africanus PCS TaxID=1262666 RepID=M5Q296_DESAF|nr:hypothetical protein [Desulfocurvibacter africanus]EMG37233.1 hypothetical protein PCS_02071 [Desulfocurvibacter africanus PCS]